jgi:hypothetical protein
LITATILIMGMLIQGCRTQQPPSAEAAIQPVVRPDLLTPRQATNPLPTPMAQAETAAETNWITPPIRQPARKRYFVGTGTSSGPAGRCARPRAIAGDRSSQGVGTPCPWYLCGQIR